MNTDAPFDPSLYVNAPTISATSGIALARALVDDCPKGAPAAVKKAAQKLAKVADQAQTALAIRSKEVGTITEEAARSIDEEADHSWTALRDRLKAYAALPVARFPRAARAAELVQILFSDGGLDFLKQQYPAQKTHMAMLLERIDSEKLAADIAELAGSEFLAQLRDVQPRYEDMVRRYYRRADSSMVNLREEVQSLQRAIVRYANQVTASVDEDEPKTEALARKALNAIDVHRGKNPRNPGQKKQDGEPTSGTEPQAQATAAAGPTEPAKR